MTTSARVIFPSKVASAELLTSRLRYSSSPVGFDEAVRAAAALQVLLPGTRYEFIPEGSQNTSVYFDGPGEQYLHPGSRPKILIVSVTAQQDRVLSVP